MCNLKPNWIPLDDPQIKMERAVLFRMLSESRSSLEVVAHVLTLYDADMIEFIKARSYSSDHRRGTVLTIQPKPIEIVI